MQYCLKRSRVIAWTVVLICLASASAITLSRIHRYERQGTLLDIQPEIDSAEGALRRYNAALGALQKGVRRAGVQTQQAVVTMVRTLEQKREEALIRSLNAQVNYAFADFVSSDLEILTNFTRLSDATNVAMRFNRAGIETQMRTRARNDDHRESYHLLVRKADASRAREALPGVLTAIRETNAAK